jgi:tetratricopeptide (TPR) repeat protein
MSDQSSSAAGKPDSDLPPTGDRYDLSGDFRGAVINIKSTIVGPAEVKDIEDLPPEPGESPFLGLQYFDEADADRFFGRELLTARIAGRLHQNRFLAVIGASGSGKSSLVRAGVIPALRRGERLADGSMPPTASNRWEIHIITPTAHPLESLAATLLHKSDSLAAVSELQTELAENPLALNLAVRRSLTRSSNSHFLLVIDQFEELYTLCRHPAEQEAFLANLLSAVDPQSQRPVTVLIVLRADFYAQLAQNNQLRELVSQNQEFIGAMSRDELFRAIVQPAALGNWKVQEGLVEVMLREVGDEPGALPLLSHALLETWKRRRGRTLTLSGYSESGGVRGAIAQTAEAVFRQRLTPEQRPIARMIFVRLAELGTDSQDTRRRAAFSELITVASDERVIQTVLSILIDARLIITGTLPPGDEQVVEVAHEALIREWPTLRSWLDENREDLILHRSLTADANDWIKLERDPGALYRGARLRQMETWKAGYSGSLSLIEQEFLQASQANELAEEHKALQLSRARRLQRISIGVSAVLAVALLVYALISTGVIASFRTPARMQGIYNLAVAEIGRLDMDGVLRSTENNAGLRLSGWLAGFLKEELSADLDVWVWTDGSDLRRQNVKIGRVDQDGTGDGAEPAQSIAGRLDSDMLIYGNIDLRRAPAELTLEFWLTPQDYGGFEEIQGVHRITSPITILNPRDPGLEVQPELRRQSGALAWIAMGLTHAQLGQSQAALQALQKAEVLLPESEVVQFLLGREYLFQAGRDPVQEQDLEAAAEQAFQNSTRLNQQYARGFVGLGSVYFTRAQRILLEGLEAEVAPTMLTTETRATVLLDQAIAAYQFAIDLQPDPIAYGAPVAEVAELGLGKSYRLKGLVSQQAGDLVQAAQFFDLAIQTLASLGEQFSAAGQPRYQTQTLEGLANAYFERGYFYETQQLYTEMLEDYELSLKFYDECIAQGEGSPDEVIRKDIVAARCLPFRAEIQKIIDSYSGSEG